MLLLQSLNKKFPYKFSTTLLIIFISVFLSSGCTYLLTSSKAEGEVKIHYIPVSLSPSPLDANVSLSILDFGDYTNQQNVNDPDTQPQHANPNVFLHGDRNVKKIALTFDAEMTDAMRQAYMSGEVKSSYDKRIIDILTTTNTKATIFLTGMWIELYPKETKELSQNPLIELGSHSFADTSFDGSCYGLPQVSESQGLEDIERTQILLKNIAGIDNHIFRFPGGCYSQHNLDLVNSAGLTVVHWDVVGNDGFNENTDQIVHNIIDNVKNGSIIILHLNGTPTAPKTAEALPQVISQLQNKGFEFVKVSELLGL